jgi:hypothetical protein
LARNHVLTQGLLKSEEGLLSKLFNLSQGRFKDKSLTIQAGDIIENLTNKNYKNDPEVKSYLQGII